MRAVSRADLRRGLGRLPGKAGWGGKRSGMDIERLIAEYGTYTYLIAFVWTFLEGETIVLFSGFAAAQGLLNPGMLLVAAWLGSFAGDQLYFWIGRHFGQAILNRFPRWRYGVDAALRWLERYNTGFILSFRFIYGVRNLSSFAMGLSAIRWQRFLSLNFLAAGLWATSFIVVGYFLGHAFRAVLGHLVRSFSLVMLGAFIAFAVAVSAVHRLQRRRQLRVPAGAKVVIPPP
jgi:membrane protein DedA with SNARE-associated domain